MAMWNSKNDELKERENSLKEKEEALARDQAKLALSLQKQCALADKLDLREKELKLKEDELDQRNMAFLERETALNKRLKELELKELEARGGFAELMAKTFAPIEQQLREREEACTLKLHDIEAQKSALCAREQAVAQAEYKRDEGFAEERLTLEKELEMMRKDAAQDIERKKHDLERNRQKLQKEEELLAQKYETLFNELEAQKASLNDREKSVRQAELVRDNEFADQRKALEDELFQHRVAAQADIDKKHREHIENTEKEIAEMRKVSFERLEAELKERTEQIQKALEDEREVLEKEKENLEELKRDLEFESMETAQTKRSYEAKTQKLEELLATRLEQERELLAREKRSLQEQIDSLQDSLQSSRGLISNFQILAAKLDGEDAASVLKRLHDFESENKRLRDELISRPAAGLQADYDRLCSEMEGLQKLQLHILEENERLKQELRPQKQMQDELADKKDEYNRLENRYRVLEADHTRLQQDLDRIQASYKREADREARIREIEVPLIEKEKLPATRTECPNELEWLDGIMSSCDNYGLHFPRRILHSFHTSLKIAEWSPLTVLAGVSGTGKSELPRLYSHFGGINFLSLPVQPNWDSQESMLGFFNSLDNKFDAQPVLRLLAQSQKDATEDYPGLRHNVTLILLDEMNLAHVELYFAEFLSKLELRRGKLNKDAPSLEVKLGAGMSPYLLPLRRNVLWAGTMNQDETTKSLSDKVLDRGIVINFPRPTTLERRSTLVALTEPMPLLTYKHWHSWRQPHDVPAFTSGQIREFKEFAESINESLSKVGRALGHRVWQSIEHYMANYPDVLAAKKTSGEDSPELRKAMRTAFEDQLVQKVMPKLRGIETRGFAKTDCLDRIRGLLLDKEYSIVDDFDLACKFGYGQFIWNSANYLKEDSVVLPSPADPIENVTE